MPGREDTAEESLPPGRRGGRSCLLALAVIMISAMVGLAGWHCLAGSTPPAGTSSALRGSIPLGGTVQPVSYVDHSAPCLVNCEQGKLAAGNAPISSHQNGPATNARDDSLREGTEALLETLGDRVSRDILLTVDEVPMTAHELTRALNLPQATIYMKLHQLTSTGLLAVLPVALGEARKGTVAYLSLLDRIEVRKQGKALYVSAQLRNMDRPAPSARAPGVLQWAKGAFSLHLRPSSDSGDETPATI